MNEQQLADLFSEQIDHLLDGQAIADTQGVEELSGLFGLGQELSQVSFQASPAAQAAFLTQLTGWFGAPVGLTATILSTPKIWLAGLLAAITLLGAGLGLFGLLKSDTPLVEPDERIEAPATVELPPTSSPVPSQDNDADANETEPQPNNTSTVKDSLPAGPPSLGDTLPTPIPSSEPTIEGTDEPVQPSLSDSPSLAGDDGDGNGNNNASGEDHDRGHGNDPDGYDEDNPGDSSGLPGGGDKNQDDNGSPGNIDRGQDNGASPSGDGGKKGGDKGKGGGKK